MVETNKQKKQDSFTGKIEETNQSLKPKSFNNSEEQTIQTGQTSSNEESQKQLEPNVINPVQEKEQQSLQPVQEEPALQSVEEEQGVLDSKQEVNKKEQTIKPSDVQVQEQKKVIEEPVQLGNEIDNQDKKIKELEVKEKEFALQEKEKAGLLTSKDLKTKDQEKAVGKFNELIKSGASNEEVAKYVNDNPDYKNDFFVAFKKNYKDSNDFVYVQKYNNLDNDGIKDALSNGEIIIGDKQYQLLSDETKNKINSLNKLVSSTTRINFDGAKKVTSFNEILKGLNGIYGVDIAKKTEEMYKNPELIQKRTELEGIQDNINSVENDLETIQEDMEQIHKGVPKSVLNSIIAIKQKALIRKKNSLLNEHNSKLATYSDIKNDIKNNIELIKYESQQNQLKYQQALQQYNTDRARMDKFDLLNFQEESNYQSELRKRQWQATLIDNERKYADTNKKGTYQTDRNGNLLYLVDGKASSVIDNQGEVVGITKQKDFSDTITKGSDGGYQVLRVYQDGREPEFFTYGVTGNNNFNTNLSVQDNISRVVSFKSRSKTPGYQCGEAVNNYLSVSGIKGIRMGDTYESKKQQINSNIPQVGGLAVWNPNREGKYGENGHVGIVSGYNPNTGEVEITDWNAKGNGRKNIYTIPASQILNSDGGFVDLGIDKKSSGEEGYSNQLIPLYTKFNQGKMTDKQIQTYGNDPKFLKEAESYGKEMSRPGFEIMLNNIELARSLKGLGPVARQLPDNSAAIQKLKNRASINQLIELKKSGASFGSLTEGEFQRIQDSILSVSDFASEKYWSAQLDEYINTLESQIPKDFLGDINKTVEDSNQEIVEEEEKEIVEVESFENQTGLKAFNGQINREKNKFGWASKSNTLLNNINIDYINNN